MKADYALLMRDYILFTSRSYRRHAAYKILFSIGIEVGLPLMVGLPPRV